MRLHIMLVKYLLPTVLLTTSPLLGMILASLLQAPIRRLYKGQYKDWHTVSPSKHDIMYIKEIRFGKTDVSCSWEMHLETSSTQHRTHSNHRQLPPRLTSSMLEIK